MLVLSGRENDRFFIGDDIIVTVVEMRDGKIRLGFDAPRTTSIDREKVRKSKLEEPKDGT